MTNCKRCTKTEQIIKKGRIRNQQRYYCNSCQSHFVIGDRKQRKGYSEATKALAVLLYGTMKSSYGMIAKLLNTSRKTVYLGPSQKTEFKYAKPFYCHSDDVWPVAAQR